MRRTAGAPLKSVLVPMTAIDVTLAASTGKALSGVLEQHDGLLRDLAHDGTMLRLPSCTLWPVMNASLPVRPNDNGVDLSR